MSNLTISVDETLIRRARVRAIQQGTSLSAKVREFLQHYVSETDPDVLKQREEATSRLMAALDAAAAQAKPVAAAPGTVGRVVRARRTLREELYEGDFRARDRAEALRPTARTRPRKSA